MWNSVRAVNNEVCQEEVVVDGEGPVIVDQQGPRPLRGKVLQAKNLVPEPYLSHDHPGCGKYGSSHLLDVSLRSRLHQHSEHPML